MDDIKYGFGEGISISESISQALNLKRNGASYNVSQDSVVKIGDTTTFSSNDSTTFDATTTDASVENSKNFSATYNNGVLHRSLTAEGVVKAGLTSGIETKGKITHEIGDKLISIADSISGYTKTGLTGASMGITHDTNVKVGKNVTFSGSDSTSAQANFKDASISRDISVSAKYDNEFINNELTANANQKLSLKDGLSLSSGVEHKSGNKNVASVSRGVNQSVNFDGEKSSYDVEGHQKVKLGNDNANIEQNSKISTGIDSEGNVKFGSEVGTQTKVGGVESDVSVYGNKTVGEDSESEDVGVKTKSGVQISKGAKLTNETKINSHQSSEYNSEENKTVYEDGVDVNTKTRVELDPQQASLGDIIAATIINSHAAITEHFMNDAMSSRNKTEVNHGPDEGAEAEQQAEQEAEQQAEQQRVEEAQQQLEEAERELEEARKEAEKALDEVQEAKEELNDAIEENNKAVAEAEKARQEYEEKQKAAEEAEEAAQKSGEEEDQKKAEEAKEEAGEAQENYEDKQKDVAETEEKVQDAQHGVDAAEANAADKIQDYGEKKENVEQCQANLADAQQQAQEAQQAREYDQGIGQ